MLKRLDSIYILICLALVGCEEKDTDYKSVNSIGLALPPSLETDRIDFTVPVDVSGDLIYQMARDNLPQMKGIDTKLFMIAEKLERIALALERK